MKPRNNDRRTPSASHIGKLLIASYMAAVGILILAIVVGLVVLGFEVTDKYIVENGMVILVFLTAAAFPFVRKHLK